MRVMPQATTQIMRAYTSPMQDERLGYLILVGPAGLFDEPTVTDCRVEVLAGDDPGRPQSPVGRVATVHIMGGLCLYRLILVFDHARRNTLKSDTVAYLADVRLGPGIGNTVCKCLRDRSGVFGAAGI